MTGFAGWFAGFISAFGAINWGLVSFFDVDLVKYLSSMIGVRNVEKALYGLIGVSGLYQLLCLFTFS